MKLATQDQKSCIILEITLHGQIAHSILLLLMKTANP